jgi:hypothetical protein
MIEKFARLEIELHAHINKIFQDDWGWLAWNGLMK